MDDRRRIIPVNKAGNSGFPDFSLSSFRELKSRAAVVLFILLSALVMGGWMLQWGARSGSITPIIGARLFDEVRTRIVEDYVDSLSLDQLYKKAVDGMLYELNDPYTVFLPPKRLDTFTENTTGNYAGVGLQLDMRDGWIIVITPLPGSPADDAGVATGDRIVQIDGKPTKGWVNEDVSHALRGNPGTSVSLTIERPGVPTPITFTMNRSAIHQSAVRRATMLTQFVGYIDLKIFSDSTAQELSNAITRLRGEGMRTLVLDMRSNPGGLLAQGVSVADMFLNTGQKIVSIKGRTPEASREYRDKRPQAWPDMPLVVLVNDRSASASEIVAGALQDHDRAVVVGVPTYGKGSAQTLYDFGNAGALKLTTAKWYTPVGRSISRNVIRDDEFADPADRSKEKSKFKTDAGRTVMGGGGIVPDVAAGDTTTPPENLALSRALGRKVPQFRDALTDYALYLKGVRKLNSPHFLVTADMLEEVWKRMQSRGVEVPRNIFDESKVLISRLLSYEISRYVFGPEAEFRRKAADDQAINVAIKVASGAKTQRDMFAFALKAR